MTDVGTERQRVLIFAMAIQSVNTNRREGRTTRALDFASITRRLAVQP